MKLKWEQLWLFFLLFGLCNTKEISARFNSNAAHVLGPSRLETSYDYSPEDVSLEKTSAKAKEIKKVSEVAETKESKGRDCLTIGEKTNIANQIINLITTSLTNFSVNDAIAIGVFIAAMVGIKAVVIGILIWIWFGAEKHSGGGGYSESSGYGYSQPQVGYGGTPSQGYGTPSQAYGTPSQAYGTPSQAYGTPSQAYGTPSQAYGSPAPAYGTPSTSYGYGTPSSGYAQPSTKYGKPSTNYGTPAVSYGTPSTAYSSPSTSRTSRSLNSGFDDISRWILKSVINYFFDDNGGKSGIPNT